MGRIGDLVGTYWKVRYREKYVIDRFYCTVLHFILKLVLINQDRLRINARIFVNLQFTEWPYLKNTI